MENKMKQKMPIYKLWALIGCIIASTSLILGAISIVVLLTAPVKFYSSTVSSLFNSGSQQLLQFTIVVIQRVLLIKVFVGLLIALVELAFFWLAFVKIDKLKGRGWSIFLLVMGILSLVGSLGTFKSAVPSAGSALVLSPIGIVLTVLPGFLAVVIGIAFILAFAGKRRETRGIY